MTGASERGTAARVAGDRGRRGVVRDLAGSLVACAALLTGYFVLPLTRLEGRGVATLAVAMLAIVALLVHDVRRIAVSPHALVRAVRSVVLMVGLFLVAFSTTYHLMSVEHPSSFNEPLSRLDSLYFVVTVLATVGFGDIVARTEAARAVVLAQMVANVVVLGVGIRVLVRAVRGSGGRAGG